MLQVMIKDHSYSADIRVEPLTTKVVGLLEHAVKKHFRCSCQHRAQHIDFKLITRVGRIIGNDVLILQCPYCQNFYRIDSSVADLIRIDYL